MQPIDPHPAGANNRYPITHCIRPQQTKSGVARIVFDGLGKPQGFGTVLTEAAAAGAGPGMRRVLAKSEDIIEFGASSFMLRLSVSVIAVTVSSSVTYVSIAVARVSQSSTHDTRTSTRLSDLPRTTSCLRLW